MSAKSFYLRFGSGSPANYTGLSPTFTVFRNSAGSTTPPSISELGTTGLYTFSYDILGSIAFVVDGVTSSLSSTDRYIVGSLDIGDANDQGITYLVASVGATTAAIGDSATEPTTLYGFLKRVENWLEGRATFTKSTGVLQSYDKTGATLISSRTIADNSTTTTKT